jgi:glycosyltransferase involved in cell wall biosynthesis
VFAALRALSDWWLFPDSYAGWSRRASRVVERRLERGDVDVLLTSSPPDSVHGVGIRARRPARVRWFADFRDPWMGLELRTPPTAWHRARHERLEAEVLHRADRVIAASRTHAERLRERLTREDSDPGRVAHLPNGFEPAADAPAAGETEPSTTFLLVYTGNIALMPDVEVFLEALHDLLARVPEARRRIRARLAGPYETGYADRAVALGLTGIVEFAGPRPQAQARALQRRADVLLHWQPRRFPTMVPGKLYEYLDAGRPIVALLDPATEAAELVRAGGGVVIATGDRAALVEDLERRYRAWKQGEPVVTARPAWLDEHRRERLAARLAALLDGAVEAAS